jgi:FKBP-type peptidyl-prolyl cis-trans isomerase
MKRVLILAAAALALAACQPKAKLPDQAEASKAFMEKTVKEEGVQVLPSGVAYRVVRSGPETGIKPTLRDEVKVHYEGRVFDSSYERGQPAAMPLRGLIPAWQEALVQMRPGDEWILYVPPEQGYGAEGAGGEIPPNAALIFRIELIDVLPGPGRIMQG